MKRHLKSVLFLFIKKRNLKTPYIYSFICKQPLLFCINFVHICWLFCWFLFVLIKLQLYPEMPVAEESDIEMWCRLASRRPILASSIVLILRNAMMKVMKKMSLKMVLVEGSPERTWVLDTDALPLTTTSQSQWKPGKVIKNRNQ